MTDYPGPSPALFLFCGLSPAPQCLSCSEGPRAEHRTWGSVIIAEYSRTPATLLLQPHCFWYSLDLTFLAIWLARVQVVLSPSRSFSTSQLSSHFAPSLQLLWCKSRTQLLALLNFLPLSLAHHHCGAFLLSSRSTHLHTLVSCANWLSVLSIPLSGHWQRY